MIIGMDYDGTFNIAPQPWTNALTELKMHGHTIILATMRYPSEGLEGVENLDLWNYVVYTSRKAKRKEVLLQTGLIVHVWIDDNPAAIDKDAKEIWGVSTAEGDTRTENVNVAYN